MKIILAEDNDGHALLIKIHLKELGVLNEIVHFNNGKKVIDFINANVNKLGEYLLILDLRMPRVDGFEVLEFLNESNKKEFLPTLVLSTSNSEDDKEQCFKLGFDNYLVKSTEYEPLADYIRKTISTYAIK